MDGHDPAFDAEHPSGQVRFRSARAGYLHSVVLGEAAMRADPRALAQAILLAAQVSHLKAVASIRRGIIESGMTPSATLAGPADLDRAHAELVGHRLRPDL